MNSGKHLLVGAIAVVLVACGASDPKELVKEGYAALGSGRADVAQAKFDAALARLRPQDPQFLDASMGTVEALIVSDPARAREKFLSLAKDCPRQVGEKQFLYLSEKFAGSRKFDDAVALLDTCARRAGSESAAIVAMRDRVKKQSQIPDNGNSPFGGIGYLK